MYDYPSFTRIYNQVDLSRLDALDQDEIDYQNLITKARKYHDGDQGVQLTARLREFLNVNSRDNNPFSMNIIRAVVEAITERMIVSGFSVIGVEMPADENGEKPVHPQATWFDRVWKLNQMDALQTDLHTWALRDGEAFAIVEYSSTRGIPEITVHPRYVDIQNGGDGYGVRIIYPDNDDTRDPLFAVKDWVEEIRDMENGIVTSRARRTFYYPDRVERYYHNGGEFVEFAEYEIDEITGDEVNVWPIPWVDRQGNPLGIPVVHFKNGFRPEAKDAFSIQDAVNKAMVDLMASADLSAFRIFVALGWIPTTDGAEVKADGSNLIKISPGSIIGTARSGATFTSIEPANLSSLLDLIQQLIWWAALVTKTPPHRFSPSKQIAGADTLKQQEEPLLAKIRLRQTIFGNAWEQVAKICARLEQTFGSTDGINPAIEFSVNWAEPQARDDTVIHDEWRVKREVLKVPLTTLWKEAGYTSEEIKEMQESLEYQAYIDMIRLNLDNRMGAGNTRPENGRFTGRQSGMTQNESE